MSISFLSCSALIPLLDQSTKENQSLPCLNDTQYKACSATSFKVLFVRAIIASAAAGVLINPSAVKALDLASGLRT
jgi:hypothetical protein